MQPSMLPTLQAVTWCMQPWGPDAHREFTVITTTMKDKWKHKLMEV